MGYILHLIISCYKDWPSRTQGRSVGGSEQQWSHLHW